MKIIDVVEAIKTLENFNTYSIEKLSKLLEEQGYTKLSKEKIKQLSAYKRQGATNSDLISDKLIDLK